MRLDDVHKHFAGVKALNGVSAELRRGRLLGIAGPNGAGKTTMIDVATGRHTPDKGYVILHGRSINGRSLESIGRLGLVRTFQEGAVPAELKVIDYLTLARDSGPFSGVLANIVCQSAAVRHQQQARSSAMELLSRYDFGDRAYRRCGQLSGGEQKFLTLLRAFWRQPDVLMLDEPTTALNATLKRALIDMMKSFMEDGGAIGVISHDHEFITSVADDILYLQGGEGRLFPVEDFKHWIARQHHVNGWRHHKSVDAQEMHGEGHALDGNRLFSVCHLQVGLNGKQVVQDVSFAVDATEVFGVIGPNGGGKSMILKSILSIVPRTGGSVTLQGRRIDTLPPHRVARAGLGLVLQGARVPPRLTVADAIRMAWARGKRRLSDGESATPLSSSIINNSDTLFERLPQLAARRGIHAGFLSGGEQQLLCLAMALAQRPALLMLDEPSVGLQDEVLRDVFTWLGEMSRNGLPLIVVEQDVEALLSIATRGATIEAGRISCFWRPRLRTSDDWTPQTSLPTLCETVPNTA